uniref:Uncharacterized protein n=1 Tax=Knipowitschia caucasica TaxID=637954 RepID=A0AAV2JM70_KNICA
MVCSSACPGVYCVADRMSNRGGVRLGTGDSVTGAMSRRRRPTAIVRTRPEECGGNAEADYFEGVGGGRCRFRLRMGLSVEVLAWVNGRRHLTEGIGI